VAESQQKPPDVHASQADLLEFLNTTNLELMDLEYIMQRREALTSGSQDRVDQIMKSTRFKEWVVNASSQTLLIHGNSSSESISPISFFCALLVHNLRSVSRFRPLTFFCGCHSYEDYGGGRIMIMSLLTQLLEQRNFDLSFIEHELVYRMNIGDIDAFCYVFGRLIRQIPVTETVFCVIDGINFYERQEETLQEMAQVLRFLLDLTSDRTVFKILVTSPSTTEDVRQAVEDKDYLALPAQGSKVQEFSDLRFERQWKEGFEI
jgi:hypothetical protein